VNQKAVDMIRILKEGRFEEGYQRLEKWLSEEEQRFMEELTVNTATDLVSVAVLYCQFSSAEKKPWKAIPVLDRVRGALRFLKDFIADREVLASTLQTVGNHYAYAGFFPEAAEYFSMALQETTEENMAYELAASYLYYHIRSGELINGEVTSRMETRFGKRRAKEMIETARRENEESLLLDPVEHTPEFLKIRFEIEREVDADLSASVEENKATTAFCFSYWSTKKKLLYEKFQIRWKTPAEMNPNVRFG